MASKKKTLTNKAYHDIIKKNHKVFEVNADEDYGPGIGAEITSWFEDYDVTFASIRTRLFIYNNQGLVWLYDVQIKENPAKPKENIWSNFFGLWSK